MSIIKIKKIWEEGEIVAACNQEVGLNCEKLNMGSLKPVWVVRKPACCGSNHESNTITFKDPNDSNALTGIWAESDGKGVVIDASTVDDVIAACNACCGESTDVAPNYNGEIPAISEGSVGTYCITRADAGNYYAINNAYLDYQGNYITMVFKSNASGVSKYQVTAHQKPVPVGADTVATGVCS